jgi:hypothetical protein
MLLLALFAAPAAARLETTGRGSSGPDVSRLRVCGQGQYDAHAQQCKRDERKRAIETDTVHCTAMVRDSAARPLDVRLAKDGEALFERTVQPTGSRQPLDAHLTLGPHPLPRGRWTCEVGDEASNRVSFRTSGATGRFLYPAACASVDTVDVGGSKSCHRDASRRRLRDVDSVTCSAVLDDVAEKPIRLEIEFKGEFDVLGSHSVGYTRRGEAQSDIEIANAYITLDTEQMTMASGPLPPGPYECRWIVDGETIGSRSFEIAA